MANTKPVIAITAGDINGVGYEIIIKGIADAHITEICTPIVYGNLEVLKQHAKTLSEEYRNISFHLIRNAQEAKPGKLNLMQVYPDNTPVKLGESTPEAGKASFAALKQASEDIKKGLVDALVTAPINKENIQSEEFRFSGHTEYLTEQFGEGKDSLMMMVSDQMKVALVCNHVPISKVANFISEERILRKLHTLNDSLENDFMIRSPRIAVLALNPHAGDNGLIGSEEKTIILPAIKKANEEGVTAFGPYSADGFFGSGKYAHFDAILGMYHDQGLIPFKSLDMDGVNFTAGLNIVRTSPDHGTAYELAGKDCASFASFSHALYMAIDILKRRAESKRLKENVLPIKVIEDRPPKNLPNKGLDFLLPKNA